MERLSIDFAESSKRCSSCGQTKGNTDLNKRKRSKDGLQAWCRECERAAHAKRYAQNPAATLERGRRWRAANPERAREASRRQYAASPDARREAKRRWRLHNPDAVRDGFASWRARNADYDRERTRLRHLANPEAARQQARQRRDQMRSNGEFEVFTRQEIGERDGWVCGLCALPIDQSLPWPHPQSQSLDHLIPLARGGRHTRSNSQITHLICNLRRGIKPMVSLVEEAS